MFLCFIAALVLINIPTHCRCGFESTLESQLQFVSHELSKHLDKAFATTNCKSCAKSLKPQIF